MKIFSISLCLILAFAPNTHGMHKFKNLKLVTCFKQVYKNQFNQMLYKRFYSKSFKKFQQEQLEQSFNNYALISSLSKQLREYLKQLQSPEEVEKVYCALAAQLNKDYQQILKWKQSPMPMDTNKFGLLFENLTSQQAIEDEYWLRYYQIEHEAPWSLTGTINYTYCRALWLAYQNALTKIKQEQREQQKNNKVKVSNTNASSHQKTTFESLYQEACEENEYRNKLQSKSLTDVINESKNNSKY